MTRAFPGDTNRLEDFLEKGIIAVHWNIGDLTGCTTKEQVAKVVADANLKPRNASLKTGLLFRFSNLMKIGDYCIVPFKDVFYLAIIKSNYYFDSASVTFEHQRKVEWLFDAEPFGREELPKKIQTSLKSQLGLADLTQHESLFKNYLLKKQKGESWESEGESMADEMNSLETAAMNIIKAEIASDDPDRRLQAAIAIMELNYKIRIAK